MDKKLPTAATGSRNVLAACVAAILGVVSPAAFSNVFVTNCNDTGGGSLRSAVAGAPPGATVDLTGLDGVCSTISLKTGAIPIGQASLNIVGPGAGNLTITAKYNSHQYMNRIFTHYGTGELYVKGMTLSKGYVSTNPARGGCIYSAGSVTLQDTTVTECEAITTNGTGAIGGGVFAKGAFKMNESTVKYNTANNGTGRSFGGGVYSNGLRAYYSSITGNTATNTNKTDGYFGGFYSPTGNVYLYNSTVARNQASHGVGAFGAEGLGNVKIVNSTISSNSAPGTLGFIGGAYVQTQTVQISNSTVAANTATLVEGTSFPVGLVVVGTGATPTFVMQSSIVAGNLYGSPPAIDNDFSSSIVVTGNNNLIQVSNASVPVDTIVGKCAFLGNLKDNGGLTLTQAVQGHSPALNAGNNTFGAGFDQRGKKSVNGDANYPRVLGAPGVAPRADIGAYEVNGADEIYDSDFDSC